MHTLIFQVKGLTCQGCVRSVTKAIQKADPQAEVKVSEDLSRLEAHTHLQAAQVLERIAAAGFEGQLLTV